MGLLGWPIFIILILFSFQGFAVSVECDEQHFAVGSRCCEQCPPGYYRDRDCDEDNHTRCLPCPQGTYTEVYNYADRCVLCKRCPEDHAMEEEIPCLPNQNRKCRCMKGFFLEPDHVLGQNADTCNRHQRCQPGEGVKKEGTRGSDTTCAPCAIGTFSPGGNLTCHDWTDCASQGLKEMIPGTTEHDAVCGYEYIPPIVSSVTEVPTVTETTSGSVSDRVETPGMPVAKEPDEHEGQLSSSTANPLQYGPGKKEREGTETSQMSKKGNDTSATLAVGIVVLILLIGGIGVAAYCGYTHFIKEKGRTGENGVSVSYHPQGQTPEHTVLLNEAFDQGVAVSAEPPTSLPPGQWQIAPLEWPPRSSEIPAGSQNEGSAAADPPQIVFNIDNWVITTYDTAYHDNSTTINDSSKSTTVQDCENVLVGDRGTINVTSTTSTSDNSTTVEGNTGGVQIGNSNNM